MTRQILIFLFACISPMLSCCLDACAQADKQLVEMADMTYAYGARRDALDQYLLALKSNPENERATYMAGRIFLESDEKSRALKYLLKAQELDDNPSSDIQLLIGMAHHAREEFGQAVDYYAGFKNEVIEAPFLQEGQKQPILKEVDRLISMANTASTLKNDKRKIKLIPLGENINSEYPDYAPALTADGKTMVFTSRRRGGMSGNKDRDNQYFEDIYISYFKNGEWTPAQNLGAPVNTEFHDASIGISPDGKTLFLYRDEREGDLYSSQWKSDSTWSIPVNMGRTINSNYKETSVTVSADNKRLIFASKRPGGQGGFDLYMSEASKPGKWETPVNLGKNINTPYEEESPYMTPDGKTLYFSSTGHIGMGGYDIFRSKFDEATKTWGPAENIGYPINSVYDDIYYLQLSDSVAYYSTVKDFGLGEQDIIKINLFPMDDLVDDDSAETVIEIDTASSLQDSAQNNEGLISTRDFVVNVYNDKNQPMDADVNLNGQLGEPTKMTSKKKGIYRADIGSENGNSVRLSVESPGYVFYNDDVTFPKATEERQVFSIDVYLMPVKTGMVSALRNVYFDFGNANLKTSSYNELDKIKKLMNDNPDIRVRIIGHTDKVGDTEFNRKLSTKRAESVVKYLKNAGIADSRLEAVGLGESSPLVSNDDEEEGRALNRRTEFEILDKASKKGK